MGRATRQGVPHRSDRIVIACFAAILCLFVLVRLCTYRQATVPKESSIQLQLDPNTASWQDLAALPELGENAARRIIAYREKQQAAGQAIPFRKADDLDAVKGIGPRTIEELRPYLRFPATQP